MKVSQHPFELDLTKFIECSKYDARYGIGVHLIRDAKTLEELETLQLNAHLGNITMELLKNKIAKLLVKQCRKKDLLLLHGDPRLTEAAETLLAKRMRS